MVWKPTERDWEQVYQMLHAQAEDRADKDRREFNMDNFNEVLAGIVEDISKNTRAFEEEKRTIREDPNLSTEGKANRLTELYQRSAQKHKELKAKLEQHRTDIKRSLHREAFSPGQRDLPAFNAALERADKALAQGEPLDSLLSRADKTGDTITIQAIALLATERGFGSLLDRVKELLPDKAEALDNIAAFETTWGDARSNSIIFQERMYTSGPRRPEEVPGNIAV